MLKQLFFDYDQSGRRLSIHQLTATSWRMERTMFCLVHSAYQTLILYLTSVSETIRKPPLVKAQTAFKKNNNKLNMAKNDFQYGGWNYYTLVVARSSHWFRQVTAPCNVALES